MMTAFRCEICKSIQEAESVPDICFNCASQYSGWLNLATNNIEKIAPPERKINHPVIKPPEKKPSVRYTPKPVIKAKPKPTFVPKHTALKVTPPPPPVILTRPAGIELSKSNFNINIPCGAKTKELVIIRNLDTGGVIGRALSSDSIVTPAPASFNFSALLVLSFLVDARAIAYPVNRTVFIDIHTNKGDKYIQINLRVMKTSFWKGLKFLFTPWT